MHWEGTFKPSLALTLRVHHSETSFQSENVLDINKIVTSLGSPLKDEHEMEGEKGDWTVCYTRWGWVSSSGENKVAEGTRETHLGQSPAEGDCILVLESP